MNIYPNDVRKGRIAMNSSFCSKKGFRFDYKILASMNNSIKSMVFMIGMIFMGVMSVHADSRFRDENFKPTIAQRSGLALLRIVGSPLSMFTEGVQYFNEYEEATGRSSVLHFVGGMCIQGSVVACLELVGGSLELITFQQFKSFAYPWEIDENDPDMVRIIKESEEQKLLSESDSSSEYSSSQSYKSGVSRKGSSSSFSYNSGTRVKPRVRHSSCRGTGRCNICKGKGYVGSIRTLQDQNRLRCRGCGGSGSCSACGGSGYSN